MADASPSAGAGTVPRPEADDYVERNLRFNFGVLLAHGLLGQTGFRLVNAPTFLPAYVTELAGTPSAIGIARAIQSFGMFLSPFLSARMIERRSHAKGLALIFGSSMRVMILAIALIALFSGALFSTRSQTLVAIWIVMGVWGIANGGQMVAFNFLMSKSIPPDRRGSLLGLRNAAAGVTLLGVAVFGGWLVDAYGFPTGYGLTFLTGFALATAGLIGFAFLREPEHENHRASTPFADSLREVPSLFRNDRNFRGFVVSRLLATAARGAIPFYIVLVGERHGLSGTLLAGLTIAFQLSNSSSSLLWGLMADRVGFRAVFISGVVTWMAGSALLLSYESVPTAFAVFILVGAGMGGFMMSSQQLVLEFGTAIERPMRIAATNSLSELVGAFAVLLGGVLAGSAPLAWVFGLAIGTQALAVARMIAVAEPRHSRQLGDRVEGGDDSA